MNGEQGLVIEFGTKISPEINGLVQRCTRMLQFKAITGVIEIVPTYRSVMVYFNPLIIARQELIKSIEQTLGAIQSQGLKPLLPKIVYVPVCYGGVLGPDLDYVARYTGLSRREVITSHTAKPYLIYMLGFAPGFPYLGGLSDQLAVPRQDKPRLKVPAGSVGIGGNQTGFYPVETPGEWWLIGRTPIKVFNPESSQPILASAGDYIQFVVVTVDDYFAIRHEVQAGTYVPELRPFIMEGEVL